jgi:hypothetical protein
VRFVRGDLRPHQSDSTTALSRIGRASYQAIPPEIMAEHRALAMAAQDQPLSRIAAAVIMAIWVLAIGITVWLATRYLELGLRKAP